MKSTIPFCLAISSLIAPLASVTESNATTTSTIRIEKCYGISKAGANDCANATGTHQCAGYSSEDNDPAEWILTPKGTCEKIVGGSIKPKV